MTDNEDILKTVQSRCRLNHIMLRYEFAEVNAPTPEAGRNRVNLMDMWRYTVNGVLTQTPEKEIENSPYFSDVDKFWQDMRLGLQCDGSFS